MWKMLYFWKKGNFRIVIRHFLLLFISVLLLHSCTRDDLCPAGTSTTPGMIVTFRDFSDPELKKRVEGLSIEVEADGWRKIISRTTTDSIVLPLNVNSDRTAFRFIQTTITGTDTLIRRDRILFTYSRKDIYVNRACGFRAEFENLNAIPEGEPDWIQQIIIKRDSIVDENTAHINILH